MMIEAAEMLRPIAEKKIVPDSPEAEALREQAARRLEVAHDLWPADLSAMFAAGDQMERASWFRSGQEKIPLLNGALDRLQICIDRAQSAKAMNLAFFIRLKLSEVTGDEAHHEAALELAKTMTELDPNGITSWRRLGDLLWRLDRAENAAAAYERALLNNGNFALDPLKQLPEKDRLEIERRVDEARSR